MLALCGFFLLAVQTAETPKQRAERREKECTELLKDSSFSVKKISRKDICVEMQLNHYLPGDTTYSMIINVIYGNGTRTNIEYEKEFTYLENNVPVFVVSERYKMESAMDRMPQWKKVSSLQFVFDKSKIVEYDDGVELITGERLNTNKNCLKMMECTNERIKALPPIPKN
jgi:hypothetical protein